MIKKQIFHYLFATFLVTVAYTLPHSILTVLLLEKGLSISQILYCLNFQVECYQTIGQESIYTYHQEFY